MPAAQLLFVKLNYTCLVDQHFSKPDLLTFVEEGENFREGEKIKVFCRIGLAKKFIQVFPYHPLKNSNELFGQSSSLCLM